MATIHYRNAVFLIGGYELSAALHELSVTVEAEMLDETAFGDTTRQNKGGLFNENITATGFAEFGEGLIDPIIFNLVGVEDILISVYADGITEGTTTDKGFMMRGIINELTLGGEVGTLCELSFSAQGRGFEQN